MKRGSEEGIDQSQSAYNLIAIVSDIPTIYQNMADYALHRACASPHSTLKDITDLVKINPKQRRIIDRQSCLPIYHAINLGKKARFEIVEYLLQIYEEGARRLVEHGRTLLHVAVRAHCIPPIIAMLLNIWPDSALCKTKVLQQTPLHYSVRYGCSIDHVRMLSNANRELLKAEDGSGRLPLHVALRNRCSQDVINWILRKDPTACMVSDKCGYHPAAIAVLATCRLPALRLVLSTWEGALLEVTRDGDSLMHLACKASSPTVLKYLLHIGISTNLLNHKGLKPHQVLPRRPRKSDPSKSILGVDRNTILNCLVHITKARRSWNPMTHHLFPPEFRTVSKILALFSLRFEQHHVVLGDGRLRLPFQHILKMMDRTWFDTPGKIERLRRLQPHLQVGEFGQIPVYEAESAALDVFANRRRRRKLTMQVRTLSKKMNIDIFRIATKRVVVALDNDDDKTEEVVAQMNAVRKAAQDKIDHAKRMAKQRKDTAMLKNMARFMAERTGDFVHPLDLMELEAKEEEERRELARQGLLAPGAKLSGRAWYEFLGPNNIGVSELFYGKSFQRDVREMSFLFSSLTFLYFFSYLIFPFFFSLHFLTHVPKTEQLLRENVRMEKDFMRDVNVLHAFDNENAMHGDALMDAEWQLEQDKRETEEIFNKVEEYYEDVDEERYLHAEEKKDQEWMNFVRRAGGAKDFYYADHVDDQGSPEVVRRHAMKKLNKEKADERKLQEAWDGIASEMSEEEILLRMLGITGDEDNEWNDLFDKDAGDEEWEWEGDEMMESQQQENMRGRRK